MISSPSDNLKRKCTTIHRLSCLSLWVTFPPLTGQEFWESPSYSRYPRNARQGDQTGRDAPQLPDTIGCPVCGVEFQVSMDPRAETRFCILASRNTLDIPSSQQNGALIWTPNTTLLVWLTVMNRPMNNQWRMNNLVFTQNVIGLVLHQTYNTHGEGAGY